MKNIIDVEMTHHLRADDVFHHLRSDRCQRNRAIVASCGVVSLLEDGDNVRLLPLLRDCDLLKRYPVDGSRDWCQLVGCFLQKPGRDRIWAGSFVSLEAAEQFGYPIDVDINPRHRFIWCRLQLQHIIFVIHSEDGGELVVQDVRLPTWGLARLAIRAPQRTDGVTVFLLRLDIRI